MYVAVINCQSLTAKKASFNNFVFEHSPNIITGCESWLSSSVASAEIFPPGSVQLFIDAIDVMDMAERLWHARTL